MSKHRMIENAHHLKVPRRSRSVRRWTLCDPGKSGKMSVNEYLTVMKMSAADRLSRERTYRFQARNAEVWQAWRSGWCCRVPSWSKVFCMVSLLCTLSWAAVCFHLGLSQNVSNIGTLQSHAFKSFSHDFPICSESFDGKRLGVYTRQLWDIHYSSSSFRPPAFFSFLER